MSELPFVLAAYVVTWVVVVAYASLLALRARAARRRHVVTLP